MSRRAWVYVGVALSLVVTAASAGTGCGSSDNGNTTDGGTEAGLNDGGPQTGDGAACKNFGNICATAGDCCSGFCDPASHTCGSSLAHCGVGGGGCKVATDCCSLVCSNGTCGAMQCTSDNQKCASNAECCSGTCGAGGTCTPLNTACKTAGNTCGGNGECCSGLCANGTCQLASSFCIQPGDICAHDVDCCTGICQIASGATVGKCVVPPDIGRSNCSGSPDGVLCDDCGKCCSALCAPYATGVKICQPANGCHVEGDLCRSNTDCCGGDPNSGLPGAGNVVCMIAPGQTVGYCSGPNGCRPEGDTCHYLNYACGNSTKADDCCPPNGKQGVCQLDPQGVPRCKGIGACVAAGGGCSNDLDCCAPDGGTTACVPGPNGNLVCAQAGQCQPSSGSCTVNADCCSGLTCVVPPGGTRGACGLVIPPPPPPVDGGAQDSGVTVTDSGTLNCSLYGQSCAQASDCCNGVPCTSLSSTPCTAGDTACTCVNPIK